jgi:hypothetical protein
MTRERRRLSCASFCQLPDFSCQDIKVFRPEPLARGYFPSRSSSSTIALLALMQRRDLYLHFSSVPVLRPGTPVKVVGLPWFALTLINLGLMPNLNCREERSQKFPANCANYDKQDSEIGLWSSSETLIEIVPHKRHADIKTTNCDFPSRCTS